MPTEGRGAWDEAAASFDDEPDHGLTDPGVRSAWAALLLPLLPGVPARVADLGCGTGSVAALLTGAGHEVIGVDFSMAMLARASAKAGRTSGSGGLAGGRFRSVAANVEALPLRDRLFDIVIARHVVWALREPDRTLGQWVRLLHPGGVLALVEGRWSTGAGLPASELVGLVRRHRREADVTWLSEAGLWGKPITDERYLIVSRA